MEESRASGWGLAEGKIGGLCGIATGILFIAAFGATFSQFSVSGAEEFLRTYSTFRTMSLVGLAAFGLLFLFAVPFFISLRNVLESRSQIVANAATALSIVAFAVLAASIFVQVVGLGALADIYARETGAQRDAAIVTAEAIFASANGLLILGVVQLSTGVLLFGLLMRNSGRFPSWLAYAGILSGILGFTTALPFSIVTLITGFAFFIFLLAWIFASSVFLWRPPTARTPA